MYLFVIVIHIIRRCFGYNSRQSLPFTKWFRAFRLRISECGLRRAPFGLSSCRRQSSRFRNYKELITTSFGKLSFEPSAGAIRQAGHARLKANSDLKIQCASERAQSPRLSSAQASVTSTKLGTGLSPDYFRFVLILLVSWALYLIPAITHAAQVTLAWDKNPEPDIAGYKMHYGTSSQNYDYTVDVGNYTSCTISGLQEGKTYYFASTAYDSDRNESNLSQEIAHTIPVGSIAENKLSIVLEIGEVKLDHN